MNLTVEDKLQPESPTSGTVYSQHISAFRLQAELLLSP